MANWDKIGSRGNVEDRRGAPMALGGLGVAGVVIYALMTLLGGGDVGDVVTDLSKLTVTPEDSRTSAEFEGTDSYEVFAATVLGSNNDMWTDVFAKNNTTYTPPKLVLFRTVTQSACGGASSQSGPHYCPSDETIYLDETFFDELTKRFGAKGGDVAEAYVIAHEVGHHVQNQLGVIASGDDASSIQVELQADCFAGLWANSIKNLGVFEAGELTEAMDAAAAVGDDRIQKTTTGRVSPESWTHGSSEQRVNAFTKGFDTGVVSNCSNL